MSYLEKLIMDDGPAIGAKKAQGSSKLKDIFSLKRFESWMQVFYHRLSEKDKRGLAALEAYALEAGGITKICELFDCHRDTVRRGAQELEWPSLLPEKDKIRHPGGGRKGVLHENESLDEKLDTILDDTTAGDPMNLNVIWTHLDAGAIAEKLEEKDIKISNNTVRVIMKDRMYSRRKPLKKLPLGTYESRDEQFRNILRLIEEYKQANNPVISVDTKKKEQLGCLYRDGKLYIKAGQQLLRWDHDYSWLSEGVIIPHGIYDFFNNSVYMNIGTSKETSEFACDSIRRWWNFRGRYDWSYSDSILMLSDSGGSNSYRSYLFKQDLQNLADSIGKEIRVAHYPPYCSKWNYIEHRVFPHITRSLSGVVFENYETFKTLVETTKTKAGLRVRANIINKEYKTGRKYSDDFKNEMPIYFDEYLSELNYTAMATIN